MKTVVLTGITGFVGSRVARALVQAGYSVVGLWRGADAYGRLRELREKAVAEAGAKIALVNLRASSLESIFAGLTEPAAVIHCAVNYGRPGMLMSRVLTDNAVWPLRLVEQAIVQKVPLVLNTDTSWGIGYPKSQAYTLSKKQFLQWGVLRCAVGPTRFVSLRLFNPYGPGEYPEKFVPQVLRRCLAGGDLELTPGEQRRDFLHIDDVAAAFLTVLEASERIPPGALLDCGSGVATSVREFVELVHRMTGGRATLKFGALPYREGEVMLSRADTTALRALRWVPTMGLEEGLKRTLQAEVTFPTQAVGA